MARQGATATIERRVQRIMFCYEHARRLLELRSNSTRDEQHSFAEWARIALEYGPKTNACDIYITIQRTFMYYFETCTACNGTGNWKPENKHIGLSPTCTECNGRGVVMKKKEDFPTRMQHVFDALNYYVNAQKPIPIDLPSGETSYQSGIAVVGTCRDTEKYLGLNDMYYQRYGLPPSLPEHSKIKPIAHVVDTPLPQDKQPSSFTLQISDALKKFLTSFNNPGQQFMYGGRDSGKLRHQWLVITFLAANGYDMSTIIFVKGGRQLTYEEALKECPFPDLI